MSAALGTLTSSDSTAGVAACAGASCFCTSPFSGSGCASGSATSVDSTSATSSVCSTSLVSVPSRISLRSLVIACSFDPSVVVTLSPDPRRRVQKRPAGASLETACQPGLGPNQGHRSPNPCLKLCLDGAPPGFASRFLGLGKVLRGLALCLGHLRLGVAHLKRVGRLLGHLQQPLLDVAAEARRLDNHFQRDPVGS